MVVSMGGTGREAEGIMVVVVDSVSQGVEVASLG